MLNNKKNNEGNINGRYTKSYNNFKSHYDTDLKLTNDLISSMVIILKNNNNNENIIEKYKILKNFKEKKKSIDDNISKSKESVLKNLQEMNLKPENNVKKMYQIYSDLENKFATDFNTKYDELNTQIKKALILFYSIQINKIIISNNSFKGIDSETTNKGKVEILIGIKEKLDQLDIILKNYSKSIENMNIDPKNQNLIVYQNNIQKNINDLSEKLNACIENIRNVTTDHIRKLKKSVSDLIDEIKQIISNFSTIHNYYNVQYSLSKLNTLSLENELNISNKKQKNTVDPLIRQLGIIVTKIENSSSSLSSLDQISPQPTNSLEGKNTTIIINSQPRPSANNIFSKKNNINPLEAQQKELNAQKQKALQEQQLEAEKQKALLEQEKELNVQKQKALQTQQKELEEQKQKALQEQQLELEAQKQKAQQELNAQKQQAQKELNAQKQQAPKSAPIQSKITLNGQPGKINYSKVRKLKKEDLKTVLINEDNTSRSFFKNYNTSGNLMKVGSKNKAIKIMPSTIRGNAYELIRTNPPLLNNYEKYEKSQGRISGFSRK